MKRLTVAAALFACMFCTYAADSAPSAVMRQMPSIPDPVKPEHCDKAEALTSNAEQRAMQDMMRVQQLAMQSMSAGASRISDKQGKLIAKIGSDEVILCEQHAFNPVANAWPQIEKLAKDFEAKIQQIREETRKKIIDSCPVIGMADQRSSGCEQPISQNGIRREEIALSDYIGRANEALAHEINVLAACVETREKLAEQAEAARLPVQYISMAHSAKANGWQQVATLAEHYRYACGPAANEAESLRNRK